MRAKITVEGNNVTVERDALDGERTRITYFVPHTASNAAGYVRIRDSAGQYPQVCERLYGGGDTLMATPDTLASVIRRELRRRVADERRGYL